MILSQHLWALNLNELPNIKLESSAGRELTTQQ